MDYNRTLEIVLSSLLGGGGLAALVTAWFARKSRQRGVSAEESVAVSQAAAAQQVSLEPQWESINSLNRYWQKELATLRGEFNRHRQLCDQRAKDDEAYIDVLQAYIWENGLRPPPREGKK